MMTIIGAQRIRPIAIAVAVALAFVAAVATIAVLRPGGVVARFHHRSKTTKGREPHRPKYTTRRAEAYYSGWNSPFAPFAPLKIVHGDYGDGGHDWDYHHSDTPPPSPYFGARIACRYLGRSCHAYGGYDECCTGLTCRGGTCRAAAADAGGGGGGYRPPTRPGSGFGGGWEATDSYRPYDPNDNGGGGGGMGGGGGSPPVTPPRTPPAPPVDDTASDSSDTATPPATPPGGSPGGSPGAQSSLSPIHFYVVGDCPYEEEEKQKLFDDLVIHIPNNNLGYETNDPGLFVAHVGDLNRASNSGCAHQFFVDTAKILAQSPIPVVAVPGDNEWHDCPPNNFRDNFMRPTSQEIFDVCPIQGVTVPSSFLEDCWGNPLGVTRQDGSREENFSFKFGNVIVLGLNMIGFDKPEREVRMAENLNWATGQIVNSGGIAVEIVVIIAHQRAGRSKFEDFMAGPEGTTGAGFIHFVQQNNLDVLYVHGNGHNFECEDDPVVPDEGNPFTHMTRVQVDRCDEHPPLKVTVYRDLNDRRDIRTPFEFDRGQIPDDDPFRCTVTSGARRVNNATCECFTPL